MNGSISASVVAPPSPGRRPTQKPTTMPISMNSSGFQARTWTSPSNSASIMEPLFAEFDVLAELVDDVFRLAQHLVHHLERLLAGDEVELGLGLFRLGLQARVVDRLDECLLDRLQRLGRRLRVHHVRPA